MKKEPKFYMDKNTGLILEVIDNPEAVELLKSCPSLTELIPNTSEGAAEKHLPVIEKEGGHITVNVGSVFHPMSEEHSITWIYLQSEAGCQRIHLKQDGEPTAHFFLQDGDEPIAAYAYCNLHGFWKTNFQN